MSNKKQEKPIIAYISKELHTNLKLKCISLDISIKDLIIDLIKKYLGEK